MIFRNVVRDLRVSVKSMHAPIEGQPFASYLGLLVVCIGDVRRSSDTAISCRGKRIILTPRLNSNNFVPDGCDSYLGRLSFPRHSIIQPPA